MSKFFFYTREAEVPKKDDQGNGIPLKDEQGNVIPKKFETEKVKRRDSFNLEKVIRTHMINEEHVIVLLDDGHEEAQDVPKMEKNKIVQARQRAWVQSEISVRGEEVNKLYTALEAI